MSRRTLLGVWAHPDDEAYLSAGLMAEFRRRDDRVVLVTATLGEHGTSDPVTWPPQRLAALRQQELISSLAALGVSELLLLGFEDGRCQYIDGTDLIGRLIAQIQPDVTITFGPDGMTGHPDHLAVNRWTTDAWVANPVGALWYPTLTPEFHERWGALNDRLGLFNDQPEPPITATSDLVCHIALSDEELDVKIAALREHASQTQPLIDLMGAETYREWWRNESFRSAIHPADASSLSDLTPTGAMS